MSNDHKIFVETNKNYIIGLIDVILVLARQGIAFRGHREDDNSLNQGTHLINYFHYTTIKNNN